MKDLILILLTSQGSMSQVRFQIGVGRLLAATAENVVSIFDVETEHNLHSLLVCFMLYCIHIQCFVIRTKLLSNIR